MPTSLIGELPTVESPEQRAARERAMADFQQQNETTVLDSIAAAKNLWPGMYGVRYFEKSGFQDDPNWKLTEEKLNALSQGVDDRFRVMFADAVSDEHAQVLRAHALELTGAYRDLSRAGFVGKSASVITSLADPVTLAAGIATGGLGTAAAAGGTAARLSAAARAGLITGATFGGIEAFKASQDPTVTGTDIGVAAAGGALFGIANPFTAQAGRFTRAIVGGAAQAAPGMAAELPGVVSGERPFSDYLFTAATNFGLGGLFGAIHSGKAEDVAMAKVVNRMAKDAMFEDVKASGATLTPKGEAYFREQIDMPKRAEAAIAPIVADANVANLELERLANEGVDPVTADTVVSFKTSKGSEYFVDGTTTTRNKSYHPEHGSADVGMKTKSARTVYVEEEAQFEASSALGLNAESQPSVKIEGDELVVRYKSGRDKNRNLIQREKRFPISNTPKKGMAPIEFWDGNRVHVGNEITDIRTASAKPAQVPVDTQAAPQAQADAATTVPTNASLESNAVSQGQPPSVLPTPKPNPRSGPRPFTKADLERRIDEAYQASPLASMGEDQARALEAAAGDNVNGTLDQSGSLTFTGKDFPGEIRDLLEGPDGKKYRQYFRLQTEVPGKPGMVKMGGEVVPKVRSNGPDTLAQHGVDGIKAMLDDLIANKDSQRTRRIDALRQMQGGDPQTALLLHLYDNLPEGRQPVKQTVDAAALPLGAEFTINGEKFTVQEHPDGYLVLKDGVELPIEGLSEVPVDKGTLKMGEQTQADPNAFFDGLPGNANDPLAMGAASPATISTRKPNISEKPPAEPQIGDFNPVPSLAEWDAASVRWDMGAYLGTSKSSMTRMLANAIVSDPLPKKGGAASHATADLVLERERTNASQRLHNAMDGFYAEYAASPQGHANPLSLAQFNEQVAFAQRRPRGTYTQDPIINKAADHQRDYIEHYRQYGERHDVTGFDEFTKNDAYLSRLGDRTKVDAAITEHGIANVEAAVAHAIERGTDPQTLAEIGNVLGTTLIAAPDAVRAASGAMAKMWVRNIGRKGVSNELLMQQFFEPGHRVEMADSLRSAFGTAITDAQIKQIVDILSPERTDLNRTSIARRRIRMDETYAEVMPNGKTLGIEDLLVNDATAIAERYAHAVLHASMYARIADLMTPNGPNARRPEGIQGILNVLKMDMVGSGVDVRRMNADIARAEILLKQIAGVPVIDNPTTRAVVSSLKNAQFTRLLSSPMTGIANLSELATIPIDNGFRAFSQVVPAWGSILKGVFTGTADNELIGELQRFGSFVSTRKARRLAIPIGESEEVPRTLQQIQRVTARAARVAGDLSLQSFGTDMMTAISAASTVQKMFQLAQSGRPLGNRWKPIMAAIGLSEERWARVAAELRAAPTETGILGKKIKRLDLDQWQDREAASFFVDALTKRVSQQILRDTPSQRAMWMTTGWGQLLSQMRTFAFGAWTKKLLYGVKVDSAPVTFIKWSTEAMIAGLLYMGRTYYQGSTMSPEDRQKFLEQRMTPEMVMKAGFSRAAWSSLLPTGVDAALSLTGRDPAFSFARTSGLAGGRGPWGVLIGNPTFDYMDKVARAVQGILGPATTPDREFTQADARAIRDSLFMSNVLGVKEVTDMLISRLPQRQQPN